MARVILADVYLSTCKRVWSAHTQMPWALYANHRAQVVADLWRDIEGALASLSCDGEVDVGFYLEAVEDSEITPNTLQWRFWLAGQLRPDHLSWHKSMQSDVRNGKEVIQ